MQWVDSQGMAWQVEMLPRQLRLRRDDVVLDLPVETWSRDIYVNRHGNGHLVRIDTFARAAVFQVTAAEGEALVRYLTDEIGKSVVEAKVIEPETEVRALLWPKVSPLAVWALICASLTFIPVVGLIPGFIALVLLLRHRRVVRAAEAWNHSRGLCMAATCFLVLGLGVSALATQRLVRTFEFKPGSLNEGERTPADAELRENPPPGRREGRMGRSLLGKASGGDEYHWGMIGIGIFVVLASLTVHEAAHAITAWWLGDDFARREGRVTLNPISHIDPLGTLILPLCLFLAGAGTFGWARPVPVRLDYVTNPRRAHILISLAGPGSNLLIAAASMLLLMGLGCVLAIFAPDAAIGNFTNGPFTKPVQAAGFPLADLFAFVATVLKTSFITNVFLAFFNLIPIPPLDGSWVLGQLFPMTVGRFYERLGPASFFIFLGLLYSGALSYLMMPAAVVAGASFSMLSLCTGY